MSVSFLALPATAPPGLLARSPMERVALDAGARLEQVHGWNVPADFGASELERRRLTETVGFVDRSSLAKLELQAPSGELGALLSRAGMPAQLETGIATRSVEAWWCAFTPQRVLVLSEPQRGPAISAALAGADEGAPAGAAVSILDCTCAWAALALVGPAARELLARFCAIDVRPALTPPGSVRPGSVARTPGCMLVERDDQLLVLVGWALGQYLWQVVADAADALGGGPVGSVALAEHLEGAGA